MLANNSPMMFKFWLLSSKFSPQAETLMQWVHFPRGDTPRSHCFNLKIWITFQLIDLSGGQKSCWTVPLASLLHRQFKAIFQIILTVSQSMLSLLYRLPFPPGWGREGGMGVEGEGSYSYLASNFRTWVMFFSLPGARHHDYSIMHTTHC